MTKRFEVVIKAETEEEANILESKINRFLSSNKEQQLIQMDEKDVMCWVKVREVN